jgi:hypothetical protein
VETIAEEFAPPGMHKKQFIQFVEDATRERFQFLTVNMKVHAAIRFRRNLDEIAQLPTDNNKIYDNVNKQRDGKQSERSPGQDRNDPDEQTPDIGQLQSTGVGK